MTQAKKSSVSTTVEPFHIVGISVRTTNEGNQAFEDLSTLWEKFLQEGLSDKILNKVDPTIYCVYSDYEKDYTRPYTAILGCRVPNLENVPQGMVTKTIPGGSYAKFTAKGSLIDGVIYQAWNEIWNSSLDRKYTADFEVYGEKAQNPNQAEVDIFIAVK